VALAINNTRASIPNIVITNSGAVRFDVYAGPFVKNDQFTASPFANSFLFIPNIAASIAKQVLPSLNHAGANQRRALADREAILYGRGSVDSRYMAWLEEMDRRNGVERRTAANLTLGYVTSDACPGVGDDILHAPLPFFRSPSFIGSVPPSVSGDTPIDLVFTDFIEPQLLGILNTLQTSREYTSADVQLYSPVLATEALGLYAQKAWN